MTAHPATAVVADAVVNLDGTGTWSVDGGTPQPIAATTAAAVRDEVLHRTVVAAAERGTAIELTATLGGVPALLRVSPTGEITRFDASVAAPAPESSPEPERKTATETSLQVPWREQGSRPPWAVAAAVGALAAAAVAALVFVRAGGGSSLPPPMVPTGTAAGSSPAAAPSPPDVAPAADRPELDVSVTAGRGGLLTARVRATDAPTVATLTLWRGAREIASRRLRLAVARVTWSSRTITFTHTVPGSYRWAATAPGATRVTGTFRVPMRPIRPDRRVQRSVRPVAVRSTPAATSVPAPAAPGSPSAATARPASPAPPPATPPPTRQPPPHDGPVPGGSTSPPHTGPRP